MSHMLSLLGPCTASSATRLIGSMAQLGERCTDRGRGPPVKAQRAIKNATLAASGHSPQQGATCTDELATEIEWHAAGASRMYLPAVYTQLRGMRDQLNTRKQHNHSHTNEMANEMAR
jgi:hypothetical protein